MQTKVSVFLPLSRPWRVDAMAKQIVNLYLASHKIVEVLVIIDNKAISPQSVKDAFVNYNCPYPVTTFSTGNPGASEYNMATRRARIVAVFELAKRLLSMESDFVFTIEDDTEFGDRSLVDLIMAYNGVGWNYRHNVGIVSGIQVGRWGFKIVGAWKVDNYENPKVASSMPYKLNPTWQEVDAAGFYCFITPRKLFSMASFRYDHFGPDFYYGLSLRHMGCRNYINWAVTTGHVISPSKILWPDEKCVVVKFEKSQKEWQMTEPSAKNIKTE